MTAPAGPERAALNLRVRDVVHLDGRERTVIQWSAGISTTGGLTVLLVFADGGRQRLPAGVLVPMKRPE